MHLTRMSLNPARRGCRHLVASPQRMHAAVLGAFHPDHVDPRAAEGRVLWRVDGGGPGALTLYVSSPAPPDLTHVVEQAGWPTLPDPWQTASTEPFLSRLTAGQRWAFRLTANPSHQVRVAGQARSQPLAHVTAAQQEKWLLDRAASAGFRIPTNSLGAAELRVHGRRRLQFDRRSDRGSGAVVIGVATYDGLLEVEDAEALRRVLRLGLGRARAYGCGLLTLAPAPAS